MQQKFELTINTKEEFIEHINSLAPDIDFSAWASSLKINPNILRDIFIEAIEGNLKAVKLLSLLPGADPTIDNNWPIILAALRGNLDIVKFLSTLPGVDPSAGDNAPICGAAESGFLDIVKFLSTLPNVDPSAKNNFAIRLAARKGHLEIVKFLSTLPSVDPSAENNRAIGEAAIYGHLDVVKFLSTHPGVDPRAKNDWAIRKAVEYRRKNIEVANYLASLPCYNPFAANISTDKKKEIIELLKELKLEHHIDSHRINTNKNLSFLFFNDPGSPLNNLIKDIKGVIVEQTKAIDNFGLAY